MLIRLKLCSAVKSDDQESFPKDLAIGLDIRLGHHRDVHGIR
jgi:hypothetical protein